MINLEKISGLPIELADDFHLKFNPPLVEVKPSIRTLEEMKTVLMDPASEPNPSRTEMYYMYRDLTLPENEELIRNNKLRYDITILPPVMLGKEYNKTEGHYHDKIPGHQNAHPELYEILNGKALILLQKMDSEFKQLLGILAVEAQVGDKVIYPPNYGHILVNIGNDPLVTANWVSTDEKSLYDPVKDRRGMALYVVKGNDGKPTFIKNDHYQDQPMMRKLSVSDKIRTDFGLDSNEPMYVAGMKNPKLLDFLNYPEKYALQFSSISS